MPGRPLDTFKLGKLVTRTDLPGGPFNARAWACNRCGEWVLLPLSTTPDVCPRCEHIYLELGPEVWDWIEGVIEQVVARVVERLSGHPTDNSQG